MTYRTMISRGLIAGLTYAETKNMRPGAVIDLFIYRQRYDDQQHGIKRAREPRCYD